MRRGGEVVAESLQELPKRLSKGAAKGVPKGALRGASKGACSVLLIACGALAREILAIRGQRGLENLHVTCLPAKLHNRPALIPARVREKIRAAKPYYEKIYVLYGDCGTGGMLDVVLREEGVERIGGPHCYAFFAGQERFIEMMERDPTRFFLTDYLARHFRTLIYEGYGLDRHPHLRDILFGNYRGVVYLAQTEDVELVRYAERAAGMLGLPLEIVRTGYGELGTFLERAN